MPGGRRAGENQTRSEEPAEGELGKDLGKASQAPSPGTAPPPFLRADLPYGTAHHYFRFGLDLSGIGEEEGGGMCLTCGCGILTDNHGDDRHITYDDLKTAAEAAEIPVDEAVRNFEETVKKA